MTKEFIQISRLLETFGLIQINAQEIDGRGRVDRSTGAKLREPKRAG